MAVEKVTVGLEKIFFNWILENPAQFEKVEPYYFQSDDIQFIYTVVRDEFLRKFRENYFSYMKKEFRLFKEQGEEVAKEFRPKFI